MIGKCWGAKVVIGMPILAFWSCRTTYVPVPEYHEVFVHQRDSTMLRDSIYIHDSISVIHWGDTVFMDRYHVVYRDRWRDRLQIDSFIQRDTVSVIVEVEKKSVIADKIDTYIWTLSFIIIIVLILFLIKRKIVNS